MSLSALASLDGLAETLTIESSRFAFYSSLSAGCDRWEVCVALEGEGRWWLGAWVEGDVYAMVGSRATANDIAALARDAKTLITQGDFCVSGWVPGLQRGAGVIQLIIGPHGDKPLHVPLDELSAEDAALRASEIVFSLISRSRTNTSSIFPATPTSISTPLGIAHESAPQSLHAPTSSDSSRHVTQKQNQAPALPKPSSPTPSTSSPKAVSLKAKNSPIKFNKSSTVEKVTFVEEALLVKPVSQASPSGKQSPKTVTPKHLASGASLANPNKRARRVVSLEFEDDG